MPDLATPVAPQDHAQGPASAPVTLVEYGDYQCPSCAQAYTVVKQLQREFGEKLRFVFRNYPLDQHPFAETAAETAEFADSEHKFWPMHDFLFEHQHEFSDQLFPKLADRLGLDGKALATALDDETFAERVEKDVQSGDQSGVEGTPTFFLNGQVHDGAYDFDTLRDAVQSAISA